MEMYLNDVKEMALKLCIYSQNSNISSSFPSNPMPFPYTFFTILYPISTFYKYSSSFFYLSQLPSSIDTNYYL